MSWQDYVDRQLLASRCVTKAAIAGLDGNVWARSEGFNVSIKPIPVCDIVIIPLVRYRFSFFNKISTLNSSTKGKSIETNFVHKCVFG